MRIPRVTLERLSLALKQPLRTARGTYTAREGFVVRLEDEAGHVGRGEAMPLPEFGTEGREACERALVAHTERLRGRDIGPGDWDEGLPLNHPAARHAVEQAVLELNARRRGVPLCQLLSPEARPELHVNALLGGTSPEELAEEARRAVADGYATLKLKVAGRPLEEDVARLQAVRDAVGGAVRVRLDANGGWSEPEAERALEGLAGLHPELCEQPVATDAYQALLRLIPRVPCLLAADESLVSPRARKALLDAPPPGLVLVLKPMVLRGLLPALSLARDAAMRGLESYVTSSLDGVLARAGAAHLAAALPSGAYASGLGVGHLFRDEPEGHPFRPLGGRIVLPRVPGLGVEG